MKKTFSFVSLALLAGSAFAQDLAEGVYYIKSANSDAYLTRGQNWGTQAVVEPFGLPWKVMVADGVYKLQMYDIALSGEAVKGFGDGCYTDQNPMVGMSVAAGSVEGSYTLQIGESYLAPNGSNVIEKGATAYDWKFISAEEYTAAQAAVTAAQEASVATKANVELGEKSLSLYLSDNYIAKPITSGFAPVPLSGGSAWTHTPGPSRGAGTQNYGSYGYECYQGIVTLSQSVTGLKKGIYKVGVKALQRTANNAAGFAAGEAGYTTSSAYLEANTNKVAVKDWYSGSDGDANPNNTGAFVERVNAGQYYSDVYTYVEEDGVLDLSIVLQAYWGGCWFCMNAIDLTYYLDKSSGVAIFVDEWEELCAVADSLLKLPMDEAVKSALEAATATPEETAEAYETAISKLRVAIAAAQVSTKKFDNNNGANVTALAPATWAFQTNVYQGGVERYTEQKDAATPEGFAAGRVLYQEIEGLIPGAEYEVTLCAVASGNTWWASATGDNIAQVFVNEGIYDIPVVDQKGTTLADHPYTLTGTVGKDGVLAYGIQNIANGGNWYTASLTSIICKGNPEVTAVAQLNAALSAVMDALEAAQEKIVSEKFPEVAAAYQDSLVALAQEIDDSIGSNDEFFEIFENLQVHLYIDKYLAIASVDRVQDIVDAFNAAIVAAQEAYDAAHPSAQKVYNLAMTQVNYDAPTTSYGSIPVGETITVGYNKISGGAVAFGNTAWGANHIGYLNVDISKAKKNIGELKSAILTLECSGSTDNKRTAGIGIGYNESAWSADMTYETADKSITIIGGQQWTATKSSAVFETLTFDITEALAADADGVMNLLLYNTQAAGAYIKNPVLSLDFYMAPSLKVKTIQDFEAPEVATWTSNSAANVSVGVQNGNHYAAAVQNGSGNRGAFYDASTEAIKSVIGEETAWAIEWDLAMQGGNVYDRSQAMFGIGTTASAYPANSPAITNMLFAIEDDMCTANAISKVWYIVNPAATGTNKVVPEENKLATVTLEPGVFYHYQVVYDNGQVIATITNDTLVAKVSYETTYTIADLRGFVTAVGRGSGYAYLDNIAAGTYTFAEIVEDPVFELDGEAYDTITVKLATETEGAEIKYTLNGGETLTYEDAILVDTTSVIAAWAEKNGEVSNIVTKTVVACVTPAPSVKKAGFTFGADTVTIACDAPGSDLFYTLGDDTKTYTEPFITDTTVNVVAWAVYEGRVSATTSLKVVAGEIATPVISLVKVDGAKRLIEIVTATDTANIVYALNDGAEVVGKMGKDTVIIEADTKFQVLARYVEGPKVFESAKVDTAFAAGTELQLAGVEISTFDYSAKNRTADLKVATSQLEVLLNPSVEIIWSYGEESGVAANGDVIKDVPVGATFTAYAKAAGYIDSEKSSVDVVPSYASTIFNEDYEDGTVGSWTTQVAGMLANTAAADGSHYLHFFQSGQTGGRWAQLVFPEYTSTDYILSFKWGVAAGNGDANIFTVYAGEEELFHFDSPKDLDTNSGERITTVYAADGSKIGEFGFYLKSRFEWADEKLANVEVAVSEAGVVLTIVNNLGQTQVKAKISDTPVVITKFYESLGRAYGSWRIDDVRIAGRSGAVVAPEFTLDHYEVLDPAVAITDATDKTQIFYRVASTEYEINDKGEVVPTNYAFAGDYKLYEGTPIILTDEASLVQAYAVYDETVSSDTVISSVMLRLAEVATPTIQYASAGENFVRNFKVTDNNSSLVRATLYYQAIGATEPVAMEDKTIATEAGSFGWFSVYAQVGDLKSSTAYRYADARTTYAEPYTGLYGEQEAMPTTIAGDLEIANNFAITGAYPTSVIEVKGKQLVHVAMTPNYTAVTLPMALKESTVLTNAAGDTLVLGVDYNVLSFHNIAAVSRVNSTNMAELISDTTLLKCVRNGAISAGLPMLIVALTDKVGSEVIISDNANFLVAQSATTAPTKGWRVFGNRQFKPVTLSVGAYMMNEEGTALVWNENPVVGPLQVAVMVADKSVRGESIELGTRDGIEEIAAEVLEFSNVYDLQGRKTQDVKAGQVYLQSGKKFMTR